MGSQTLTHRDNGRNGSSTSTAKKIPSAINGNGHKSVAAALTPLAARQPTPLTQLLPASAGDHYAVHQLLLSVFQAPSPAEFQAQLDEPFYEPAQRLVVKHRQKLVSHLRMVPREIHFGNTVFPATGITELATSQECRGQGFASALVVAAEEQIKTDGSVLSFVRTTSPNLFARCGWVTWGRHCFSQAGTREVLAQLNVEEAARPAPTNGIGLAEPKPLPLSTRIWRHVEEAALVRLYQANTRQAVGAIVRSNPYWHWLISRHGYEQIYVVVEGRDRLDLDESRIVGYAVSKPGRIVELMADGHRPQVVNQLLTRICGDCIERDIHSLRYDGPPHDPLHRLFVNSGGEFRRRELENQQTLMAKVLDLKRFLDLLAPQLLERVRLADLPLPLELGIQSGEEKWQLVVTNRSVKIISGKLGRNYLQCSVADFTQLVLGQTDLVAATAEHRFQFSSRPAAEQTAALFPRLNIWRPPFDELPA